MADIKKFVTKASLSGGGKPKRSALMQKIHADNITIKYMSRDGLVALIQKQRQQIKTRSALNEALLQNIKQAQSMTTSLSEKTASLPELRPPKLKKSTAALVDSKTLLRALSPDGGSPVSHGFQYRSNGDIRLSLKKSAEEKVRQYELAQNQNFQSLKQALLKATMIHCRDSKGDYSFRPVLNEVMKRESRVSKSTSGISENLDAVRFMSKGYPFRQDFTARTMSDPMFCSTNFFRDRPLIGRRYFVKENDRFISSMMQQIYLLEKHSSTQKYPENLYETEVDFEIPLKGGSEFVLSEPNFKSARNVSPLNTPEFSAKGRAKSSFNIRYGVPSNILESRKPLLDEYMHKELIKSSQTELEIDQYIKDIEDFTAKKAHKKEARGENQFGIWQTQEGGISGSQVSVSVEVPQPEVTSGST